MIQTIIDNKEWIFSGVGGAVVIALVRFLFKKRGQSHIQQEKGNISQIGGDVLQAGGDIFQAGRDIHYGLTLEQYKVLQEETEKRIAEVIRKTDKNRSHILDIELKAVQERLTDLQTSYKKEIALRKEAEEVLQQFKEQLPTTMIEEALAALRGGTDTKAAENSFDEVIRRGSGSIALAAYQSGLLAENRIDYLKAMERFQLAVTLEKDNTTYLLKAGQLAHEIADYKQSQLWLERLLHLLEPKGDSTELATALDATAGLYQAQGRYEEAEPLCQRTLAITEKVLGKEHPAVATTFNNLAALYYNQGRYKETESLYQRSLEILRKLFPAGHPNIDNISSNYAELKQKMGSRR